MSVDKVLEYWDLSNFPKPKKDMTCPNCKNKDILIKSVKAFKRPAEMGRMNRHRVDVMTKCLDCSLVQSYGLVVSEEYANRLGLNRLWSWRMMKDANI